MSKTIYTVGGTKMVVNQKIKNKIIKMNRLNSRLEKIFKEIEAEFQKLNDDQLAFFLDGMIEETGEDVCDFFNYGQTTGY